MMTLDQALEAVVTIRHLLDDLIEAQKALNSTTRALEAHRASGCPQLKAAYDSLGDYICDSRDEHLWRRRCDELRAERAILERETFDLITNLTFEYLPWDTWFKHGDLAIALIGGGEDALPQVVVDEWNDELPDLRNDETCAIYLSLYPQIVVQRNRS